MKITLQPMPFTLLFGIFCGLVFIPLTMVFSYVAYSQMSFRLIIWLYLALYAFLLTRWGQKAVKFIVFPLLLLFIISFLERSDTVFLLLCLGVLSWIRSSLCFQTSLFMMLLTEFIFSLGGGATVAFFHPQTRLAWALGIWLFFLVQSLYFVFWKECEETVEKNEEPEIDPFEQVSRQVEEMLAARHKT